MSWSCWSLLLVFNWCSPTYACVGAWGISSLYSTAVHCESFLLVAIQNALFLSSIFPATAVPCIARRQVSLWCRHHSRQLQITSEDLAALASEIKGGIRAGTTGFSDLPGVRAPMKAYGVRVLWWILGYLHQEPTRMLVISSIIQKGQPLLIERWFSPRFALVWVLWLLE